VARRVTGPEVPNPLLPARQAFVKQLAAPYFQDKIITVDPGESQRSHPLHSLDDQVIERLMRPQESPSRRTDTVARNKIKLSSLGSG